jgi:myo-inositol-1(or 4)-monophosphatase
MAEAASPSDDEVLAVIVAAARAAGAIIRASSGRIAVEATKATVQDLVTKADKECQDLIERAVLAAFPAAAFLGEESVGAGSAASAAALERALAPRSELLFVVDPIDGTANFVHGVPFSCVSIGVARCNELAVACIYEPYRDELFTAVRGRGASLNGARMAVSPEPDFSRAMLAYGLGSSPRVAAVMLRAVGAVQEGSRGQRSLGSAALHLAYVAAGRFTAFWETDLSSWDVAAGALLVAEAGGRVGDTRGKPFTLRTRDIVASNGAEGVHGGLLKCIAAAKADNANAAAV